MVELREASLDDRELLGRLLADYLLEFDGTTEPYKYFDAYWSEPERLPFLVEADGEVVGLCLVRVVGDAWHIAEFSVLPEKRRSGLGRAAVENLAERARAAKASRLEAVVHPDNLQAFPFWLAAGFRIVSGPNPVVTGGGF